MTDNKNEKSSPVAISNDDCLDDKSALTAVSNTTNKVTNETSTQHQLLNLAKQFALADGLKPADQQLPIMERAKRHQQICKIRQQKNLESIIQQALEYSSLEEITDRADADWFNSFILLAENISNQTMQALWAKILAGEIARPGSFSLKALKVFKDMSISDAKLLSKARSLSVKDPHNNTMRIISGVYQKPSLLSVFFGSKQYRINLAEFGLNFSDLLALEENSLIFIQEAETRPLQKNETLTFDYNGTPLSLSYKTNNVSLNFYKFTAIGNELSQLIANTPNSQYQHVLQTHLAELLLLN